MSTSIRNTIVSALNDKGIGASELNYYAEHIDAVAEALVEREHTLLESAIETADEQYGYGTQAKALLTDTGFEFKPEPQPEPEAEAAPEVDSDAPVTQGEFAVVVDSIDRLSKLVEKLVNDKDSDVF